MATTTPTTKPAGAAALFGSLLLISSAPALAAKDWNISPSLGITTSYTSNLELTADNEIDSMVLDITPGISFNRQGARATVSFDYSAHIIGYSASEGDDRIDHRLNTALSTELVEEHLFLDARASYSQQLIDRRDASNGDNINASDSFSDTATIVITPSWRQRIGKYTEIGVEASYDAVLFQDANDDSEGTSYSFFVDTENSPSKLVWALSAGQSNSNPDQSDSIKEDSARLTLRYRFSPQFVPNITAGWVDNHLESTTDDRADSGSFWGAGLQWRPNPRNTVDLSYNSRLQTNNSYGLTYQHRRKHSTWSLVYQESISSIRQQLLDGVSIGSLICPPGSVDFDQCTFVDSQTTVVPQPGDQVFDVNVPVASLVNDRFIQQTTRANIVAGKGKSRITTGIFYSEREFQATAETEQEQGIDMGWSLRLSRRGTASANWNWSKLESDGVPNDYFSRISVSYDRRLTPKSSLTGSVRYSERHSGDATREFEDWTAVVSFRKTF
ncbi:TIGR03016 family PEP-CTERM system-associated outer membrane protein [Motiliproteus sediminis]|uniref:TIGR03016 family PEP-CTERM system-associated outer membrane protein n=1 Tax=Motiliproteus sediminis TaxID=1468178 RepID=UPI001AEFD2F5|nr:TIGR03016 family PEP-CTERM system-associated outer membrane protein [Motiliproteus sediminis]